MGTKIRICKTIIISFLLFVSKATTIADATPKETLLPVFSARSAVFQSPMVLRMQNELNRYSEIERNGGWKKIVMAKRTYKKGDSSTVVLQLKQRLAIAGEYAGELNEKYDEQLEQAVKKAEKRFGLSEDGIADAALVLALNVPAEKRVEQLVANIERLKTYQINEGGIHLVVNIPEFTLHVYENGKHVWDMNVVVGTEKTPTSMFNAELTNIVFSPYWNVPSSIVKNEILPKMRRNRSYLSRNGYEVVGNEGGLPKIRQRPGGGNSLGKVKFLFPNPHAIYFHDTPHKSLFKNRVRAYSHGCVRLSDPAKLAAYLLKNDAKWTDEKIARAMNGGKEHWVKLGAAVPVSIVYHTAWVDDDGLLNFRDDIYNYDKEGAR